MIFRMDLKKIAQKLARLPSFPEKMALLDREETVISFFEKQGKNFPFLKKFPQELLWIAKQLVFLGQWERIVGVQKVPPKDLKALLEKLFAVDCFYREMGGLIGYHAKALSFLQLEPLKTASISYHAPSFIDIREETKEVANYIFSGILAMEETAEIYPLGGAADRLHLVDEITNDDLPAAKLPFEGRTLLEGLIRDLQAREYLYYKLFGKKIEVPIVIMSSLEKNNHFHILQILEEHRWFGRSKELFKIVPQPLVPTLDPQGNWCVLAPLEPFFKPGGHGVIWKLFQEEKVFLWLKSFQKKKALVRQINNPVAGLDYGLLALMGAGREKGRSFGFASCPRRLFAPEGVNVVKKAKGEKIVLTNVEYCDFQRLGIRETPLEENQHYSRFASNTNLLFFDLAALEKAVKKCPYPGLLVNRKKGSFLDREGRKKEQDFIRLESTMQNIADVFLEKKREDFTTTKTFATYNVRHKTISTAKRAYVEGGNIEETPEKCFYEKQEAHRELLETKCNMALPPALPFFETLAKGPPFLFLYHPALGPLYSEIAQKIRGGSLSFQSALELEISSLLLENLELDGALFIRAASIMGPLRKKGLDYSRKVGRAIVKGGKIRNRGVDWEQSRPFWKNHKKIVESVTVHLKGHSEWVFAEGILEGNHHFVVEEGERMRVFAKGKKVEIEREKL